MKIVYFNESTQEFKPYFSLVLFCKGCNLNCYHCFNYQSINSLPINESSAIQIISNNALFNPLIQAVTFLGGEPTIWEDELIDSLYFCKENNLFTKLFTNGTNPSLLDKILSLKLLDSISLDFKTINNKKIINQHNSCNIISTDKYFDLINSSLNLIYKSNINKEIRCVDLIKDNTNLVSNYIENFFPKLDLIISSDVFYSIA
ncbi:radical SAM protein [Arthrospira platensis SPKY2]